MDIMKTVDERVKQWFDSYGYECYGRRGGYADGVFLPEESDIRIEFIGIQYGALTPYEIKPLTIERSEFVNHGSLANKQTFSVSDARLWCSQRQCASEQLLRAQSKTSSDRANERVTGYQDIPRVWQGAALG